MSKAVAAYEKALTKNVPPLQRGEQYSKWWFWQGFVAGQRAAEEYASEEPKADVTINTSTKVTSHT